MPRLRTGFTTGTYAAATALAAWRCLHGRRNGRHISVRFPDGRMRRVNMEGWQHEKTTATAWATKDAGDDIDITHGATIRTRIAPLQSEDIRPEDHVERLGATTWVLRAGEGVGLVERLGLDVPQGKWAINPTPRRMIIENLAGTSLASPHALWLVETGIDNGRALARKTLNPTLGITGGLSLLGTSGIVYPASNAAYISTIRVLLKGARLTRDTRTAVLVTGGRSHRAARTAYPDLPEVAFVRIGDFIKEACESARQQGFTKVIVCCMPGKLTKYALGHAYTHAHHVALSVPRILQHLRPSALIPADLAKELADSRSVRELLQRLPHDRVQPVLQKLAADASDVIAGWIPGIELELRLISFDATQWII